MSAILCEHCLRPVYDSRAFTQQRADGRVLHLSCEEAINAATAEDDSVKAFDVEVEYRGRSMMRVIARTADEAERIALANPDIDAWDADVDLDGLEVSDRAVTEEEFARYQASEKRKAEREAAKVTKAAQQKVAVA